MRSVMLLEKFHNPNLGPYWVNGMMVYNGAMTKIVANLRRLYGVRITPGEIKNNYSVFDNSSVGESLHIWFARAQANIPQPVVPTTHDPSLN